MVHRDIVAGIDIGTTKVCTIIAEVVDNRVTDIIGVGTSPSTGLRKGMVVDIDDTVSSIKDSVIKAERMAGIEIQSVFVGIAGDHIQSKNSHGVVKITGEHEEITENDINRVIEETKSIFIPAEREIIHVLTRQFIVNGRDNIKEPLGMSGDILEAKTHIVTSSTSALKNLKKSVGLAGVEVEKVVLQPLAASKAVLTSREKKQGVVLVDMGGGTTDIAIFKDESIVYTSILPVGGDYVTNDIEKGMRIMRTPVNNAERLKLQYGCAKAELVDESEKIDTLDTSGKKMQNISRKLLCQIIEPRVEEIFDMVKDEILKAGNEVLKAGDDELIPAGVVITGGGSLLKGITKVADQELDMPVRVGFPDSIDGLLDYLDGSMYDVGEDYSNFSQDNGAIFSTGVGLVHYGAEYRGEVPSSKRGKNDLMPNFVNKVREFFGNFF